MSLIKENSKHFAICDSPSSIYIISVEKKKTFLFNKEYYFIEKLDVEIDPSNNIIFPNQILVDSILGIMNIENYKYLLVVTDSESIAKINSHEIFLIKEIDILPISNITNNKQKEMLNLVKKNMKQLIESSGNNFYYSIGFDLSRSHQEKSFFYNNNIDENKKNFDNFDNCDIEYLWNYEIIQIFLEYKVDIDFISSAIIGYVDMLDNINLDDQVNKIKLIIIERYNINSYDVSYNKNSLGFNHNSSLCFQFKEIENFIFVNEENIFSDVFIVSTAPMKYEYRKIESNNIMEINQNEHIEFKNFIYNFIYRKYLSVSLVSFIQTNINENNINFNNKINYIQKKLNKIVINDKSLFKELNYLNYNEGETVDEFLNSCEKWRNSKGEFGEYKRGDKNDTFFSKQSGYFWFVNYDDNMNNNVYMIEVIKKLIWIFINKVINKILNINANLNENGLLNKLNSFYNNYQKKFIDHFNFNSALSNNRQMMNQLIFKYIKNNNKKPREMPMDKEISLLIVTWNTGGVANKNIPLNQKDITHTHEKNCKTEITDNNKTLIPLNKIDIKNINLNSNYIFYKSNSNEKIQNEYDFSNWFGANNLLLSNNPYIKNQNKSKESSNSNVQKKKDSSLSPSTIGTNSNQNIISSSSQKALKPPIKNTTSSKPYTAKDINVDPIFTSSERYKNSKEPPDVIVISLEEIVTLSSANILLNINEDEIILWKDVFKTSLKNAYPQEEYELELTNDLVGLLMLCYVKKSSSLSYDILESTFIKSGMMGALGNKGNLLLSMKFFSTSVAFCAGHFTAGQKKNEERKKMIEVVLNNNLKYLSNNEIVDIRSKDRNFSHIKEPFKDFNLWFMFGDMNFRTELKYKDTIDYIKKNKLKEIIKKDQFTIMRNKDKQFFEGITEGKINFKPTYKFAFNSDDYDYDPKKERVPSYCDRILYKESNQVSILEYNSVNDVRYSDHKPVYGIFEISCQSLLNRECDILLNEIKEMNLAIESENFRKKSMENIEKEKLIKNQNLFAIFGKGKE